MAAATFAPSAAHRARKEEDEGDGEGEGEGEGEGVSEPGDESAAEASPPLLLLLPQRRAPDPDAHRPL